MLFISYPRELTEQCVALAAELERRRIRVWVDAKRMQGGHFSPQLSAAIKQSGAVLFLISPEAASSEWVALEAATALKAKKQLIPVLIKEVPAGGPKWLDEVMKHHGVPYYPADPHVTADKIRDLLPRHYWIRQYRPGRALNVSLLLVGLAALILLLPLSVLGTLAPAWAYAVTDYFEVRSSSHFDSEGMLFVPHGSSSVGEWSMAFNIPNNPSKARRNEGLPPDQHEKNAAQVHLKRTFRPNLRLSATVQPVENIISVDIRGCHLSLIFAVEEKTVTFWRPPDFHTAAVPLPSAFDLTAKNAYSLRQDGRQAVAFINGVEVGRYDALDVPPDGIERCRPKLQFKTDPRHSGNANVYDIRVDEFANRLLDHVLPRPSGG
jgi:hypothetical protein